MQSPPWRFPEPDADAARRALERGDQLTKPRGSLGALEQLPAKLSAMQGSVLPEARPAAALLFAADHPVVRHGVSAYPSAVTAAMVRNFAAGGAAASVLCQLHGIPLYVVDVGVKESGDLHGASGASLTRAAVAEHAVGDLRVEDAMSEATCRSALEAGAEAVDRLDPATRIVLLGEMGIGNTTAAAAVAAAVLECSASDVVGTGTGVSGEVLATKVQVVEDALARVGPCAPLAALQRLGGRDIAALVGAMARAVERGMVVLVDGFIVSTAALVLCRTAPAALPGLLFAHRSRERGHQRVLAALNAQPLLDLSLALGEGSGALIAFPLIEAACALHARMATFAEAAVPDRGD